MQHRALSELISRNTMLQSCRFVLQHRLLRVLVPIVLLAWVWSVVDGPAAVRHLRQMQWPWLAAGLLLVQLQIMLSAVRWQLTAQRLGHQLGTRQVIREYYLATLLNQLLPGGVTGDVARVMRNRGAIGAAGIGQGVVIERLAGQLALLFVTLAGFIAWPLLHGRAQPLPGGRMLMITGICLVGVVALAALASKLGPYQQRRYILSFGPALRQAWIADGAWLPQAALSFAIVAAYIAMFGVCASAVGVPLPFAGLVTVVPLTLMSMLLPVSVGGWGLREAAAAALWPVLGMSSEAGIAASIVYGLLSLAGSLPGVYVVARRGR